MEPTIAKFSTTITLNIYFFLFPSLFSSRVCYIFCNCPHRFKILCSIFFSIPFLFSFVFCFSVRELTMDLFFKLTDSFPGCVQATDESIKVILHFCDRLIIPGISCSLFHKVSILSADIVYLFLCVTHYFYSISLYIIYYSFKFPI